MCVCDGVVQIAILDERELWPDEEIASADGGEPLLLTPSLLSWSPELAGDRQQQRRQQQQQKKTTTTTL